MTLGMRKIFSSKKKKKSLALEDSLIVHECIKQALSENKRSHLESLNLFGFKRRTEREE